MAWFDTIIVLLILAFLAVLFWSKFQGQTMTDTFREIKDIIAMFLENAKDKVTPTT